MANDKVILKDFPVDAFPDNLKPIAREVSRITGVDFESVLVMGLSVVGKALPPMTLKVNDIKSDDIKSDPITPENMYTLDPVERLVLNHLSDKEIKDVMIILMEPLISKITRDN